MGRESKLAYVFLFFLCLETQAEEPKRKYTQPLQEVFQSEVVYPQEKGEIQMTFVALARDFSNLALMIVNSLN